MPRLSRRNALILGGIGIAGTAVGATGFFANQRQSSSSSLTTASGNVLIEPTELRSVDGALAVSL